MVNRFNIRVYGIYHHPEKGVLLTDEIRGGKQMTKFPGGGLNFGEGLADALKREFREELASEIEIGKLVYVNEFLQISAFNPADQLLSFYYEVSPLVDLDVPIALGRFGFKDLVENAQIFRYVPAALLDPDEMTFPIDRLVAGMIRG